MIEKTVEATVPANKEKGIKEMSAVATVQFAETLDEAKEMFGEEAVLTNAFANWRVTIQSNIRSKLKAGFTPEQIQDALGNAKMGTAAGGGKIDAHQAFIMKFKIATPEKQAEMLEMLRTAAQA